MCGQGEERLGAAPVAGLRRLVPQLVARGHQVTATTTSAPKPGLLGDLGAEAVALVALVALVAVSVGEAVAKARPDVVVHQMTAGSKWPARLMAGEVAVRMMTQGRGFPNAKAERELDWEPHCPSWRQGFREGLA